MTGHTLSHTSALAAAASLSLTITHHLAKSRHGMAYTTTWSAPPFSPASSATSATTPRSPSELPSQTRGLVLSECSCQQCLAAGLLACGAGASGSHSYPCLPSPFRGTSLKIPSYGFLATILPQAYAQKHVNLFSFFTELRSVLSCQAHELMIGKFFP